MDKETLLLGIVIGVATVFTVLRIMHLEDTKRVTRVGPQN